MYKKSGNGFTLIELMAVIVIISLIALLTFPNIVNQINKTKKSNNKMIEDIILSQAKKYVSDNKDELTEDEYCMPISTLIDNDYIKEDIVNINDIKDNKVVHITLDNNNSYEVLDKNKCFLSAVKYLLNKTNPITVTNYTDGDIHEMYTFEHEATEQTPALTDYRYIGSDPNNYVEFNNELWRIIGVFKVEDENGNWEERLKIVRNESVDSMTWKSSEYNNGWENSDIQVYIDNTYLLEKSSYLMIDNAKFYLGGINTYTNGEDSYKLERGINVWRGRKISWNGKIGLIYPSDYIFTYALEVNDACYNNPDQCKNNSYSWIKCNLAQWTMTPVSTTYAYVVVIHSGGAIYRYRDTKNSFNIYPTVYLKKKVKIISGDGTVNNAYKLSM